MVISSNLFSAVQMVTWTLKVSLSLRHVFATSQPAPPVDHTDLLPHLSVFTLSHTLGTPTYVPVSASKYITWATDILASRPFNTVCMCEHYVGVTTVHQNPGLIVATRPSHTYCMCEHHVP